MIRTVIRAWRKVDYLAADRERSVWTRLADVSLLLAFVLALPATWMCGLLVQRTTSAHNLQGVLIRPAPGGEIVAFFETDDVQRGPRTQGARVGAFRLVSFDQLEGWPFAMSRTPQPARIDLDVFILDRLQHNVAHDPDDPFQQAIDTAVERQQDADLDARWTARTSGDRLSTKRYAVSWAGNTIVMWVMLMFGFALLLRLTRFMLFVAELRHVAVWNRRRKRDQCLECGYDLRGLEFNTRCPECGHLIDY